MTNNEAISYAILTLNSLLRQGVLNTDEKDILSMFDRTMYGTMDLLSEDEAEQKANRLLSGGK
jgi:hypothetical protein